MRVSTPLAVAAVATLAVVACDNRTSQTQTSSSGSTPTETTVAAQSPTTGDIAFVDNATIAGMFEVLSSDLALQRATNPQLKAFAQMMVDDHTKANTELKALIVAGKVPGINKLPTELDGAHQAKLEELKAATDVSVFEAKYKQMQLEGHQQAVQLFENEGSGGQDPALKDFASKTLPTLKGHLTQIQALTNATQ